MQQRRAQASSAALLLAQRLPSAAVLKVAPLNGRVAWNVRPPLLPWRKSACSWDPPRRRSWREASYLLLHQQRWRGQDQLQERTGAAARVRMRPVSMPMAHSTARQRRLRPPSAPWPQSLPAQQSHRGQVWTLCI